MLLRLAVFFYFSFCGNFNTHRITFSNKFFLDRTRELSNLASLARSARGSRQIQNELDTPAAPVIRSGHLVK